MSIWSSVEAESWSRNFSYEDYLARHNLAQVVSKPLCLQSYLLLCKALEAQMEFDMEKDGY